MVIKLVFILFCYSFYKDFCTSLIFESGLPPERAGVGTGDKRFLLPSITSCPRRAPLMTAALAQGLHRELLGTRFRRKNRIMMCSFLFIFFSAEHPCVPRLCRYNWTVKHAEITSYKMAGSTKFYYKREIVSVGRYIEVFDPTRMWQRS